MKAVPKESTNYERMNIENYPSYPYMFGKNEEIAFGMIKTRKNSNLHVFLYAALAGRETGETFLHKLSKMYWRM